MFEFHGWVCLRPTADSTDEPPLRLEEIRALVDGLAGYGLMDLHADPFLSPAIPTLEDPDRAL